MVYLIASINTNFLMSCKSDSFLFRLLYISNYLSLGWHHFSSAGVSWCLIYIYFYVIIILAKKLYSDCFLISFFVGRKDIFRFYRHISTDSKGLHDYFISYRLWIATCYLIWHRDSCTTYYLIKSLECMLKANFIYDPLHLKINQFIELYKVKLF